MSFRVISILGFVFVLLVTLIQSICCPARAPGTVRQPLSRVQNFLYLILKIALVILTLTGILTGIFSNDPMRGWSLMIHVAIAPLFAIALVCLALLWADRHQYRKVRRIGDPDCWQKFLFWTMLTLALCAILSAVVPMTPTFGQHGMESLYQLHRFSSLFFVFFMILYGQRFAATR